MALIADLAAAIRPGERLRFEIAVNPDGSLTLLLQPQLAGAAAPDPDSSAPSEQLRAALAMPLRVTGAITDLDRDFPATLREFATRRGSVAVHIPVLDALREADKAGAREVQTGAKSKPAAKATATAPESTPPAPGASAQPPVATDGSLF